MPVRYCPKCNSELRYSDHYFCSNCGVILPPELINSTIELKSKVVRPSFVTHKIYGGIHDAIEKFISHVFNKANIKYYVASVALLIIGVFLGRITSVFYDQVNMDISKPRVNEVTTPVKHTIKTNLPLGYGNLTSSPLLDYIPSKIDGLFVVYDATQFAYLLQENLNIDDKTLEAASLLVNGNVAGYVSEGNWVVVIPVTNVELARVLLGTYKLNNVFVEFAENNLVISSSSEELKRAISIKNKEELSFIQTPVFVNLKGKLQSGGKILVIITSDLGREVMKTLTAEIKDKDLHNALDEAVALEFKEYILE